MRYELLAACPAFKGALVEMAQCQGCQRHVPGVGCPHTPGLVPQDFCLGDCPHNREGVCHHPKELERAEPPRHVSEVWDDTGPMCSLPRPVVVQRKVMEV